MPHATPLIATIAIALTAAFLFGFVAARLRQPPLLGYLLAGIAVGPFTPGVVVDREIAGELAEIGVMLLMFGVGMHFSFRHLLAVRGIALPGAVAQIAVATLMGVAVASLWGWSIGAGLVFGLAVSVASTVVVLRALTGRGMLDSINGRIAAGWLIVEDLAMVLALVLLPALSGILGGESPGVAGSFAGDNLLVLIGLTIGKVAAFVAVMLLVGTRLLPWLLGQVAKTGSRELFTLSVVGAALGIAYGSAELFGVSYALGAFFAGVVISGSDLSHRAAAESMPLQDAFTVLFFVSVGMLFNPAVLIDQPLRVLSALLIVMLGKSAVAFAIVLSCRYPVSTALTVSASLAQIGEFSFILAGLGVALELLPAEGRDLILAAALISITLNPLVFSLVEPCRRWISGKPRFHAFVERPGELGELVDAAAGRFSEHAIVIGHGRVGRRIVEQLEAHGIACVIVDYNRQAIQSLRAEGKDAIYGDAAMPGILERAGIEAARLLVVAAPDALQARQVVDMALEANPEVAVVVRTHSERELEWMEGRNVALAVMGELEMAASMARYALRCFNVTSHEATSVSADLRRAATAGADAAEALDEEMRDAPSGRTE